MNERPAPRNWKRIVAIAVFILLLLLLYPQLKDFGAEIVRAFN